MVNKEASPDTKKDQDEQVDLYLVTLLGKDKAGKGISSADNKNIDNAHKLN